MESFINITDKNEKLIVSYNGMTVGYLFINETNEYRFSYSQVWLSSKTRFPVSHSIPLSENIHTSEAVHSYFSNLLPEGNVRSLFAQRFGISESSDFELLKAIGGECAGAFQIINKKENDKLGIGYKADKPSYKTLTSEQINRILRQHSIISLYYSDDRKVRLSLAGAQHKIAVFYDQKTGKLRLPQNNSPSTHIIKIPSRDYKYLPENEIFINTVARHCGMNVCESVLISPTKEENIALITRFDRIIKDKEILRLHQEDFCQLHGISSEKKYQKEGGPSFADCLNVLRDISVEPALDTDYLINWLIFNVLSGNSDGHAKNIAVLYTDKGLRLSPFYDLVSTRIYPHVDRKLAMTVEGLDDPGSLRRSHWEAFSKESKVGKNYVLRKVDQYCDKMMEATDSAYSEFSEKYGEYEFVNQIRLRIRKNCRAQKKNL